MQLCRVGSESASQGQKRVKYGGRYTPFTPGMKGGSRVGLSFVEWGR